MLRGRVCFFCAEPKEAKNSRHKGWKHMTQTISLRDYQKDCISALASFGKGGGKRALVALPTGTGKTVVFSAMARGASGKVLVLAHREELLSQAQAEISGICPDLKVEIEQASKTASDDADVIVASVQTLAVSPHRLKKFNPADFSLIVVDEAHHATARTYIEVLNYFGLAPDVSRIVEGDIKGKEAKIATRKAFEGYKAEKSAPFLVGVTATPNRTDGVGLEYVFDDIPFSRSIRDMMDAGWLANIIGKRVGTDTDITSVKSYKGDYQEKALSMAVNNPERNALAVTAYEDYAKDQNRPTLVFAVDVEHTLALTESFREAGISANFVVGDKTVMEKPREEVIADFKSGATKVLVNCMVLTEGFNHPEIGCIIFARPTKSALLYTQMLGRGTRIADGKKELIAVDLVDISKAGVVSTNTFFGLPPKLALDDGEDMTWALEQLDMFGDMIPEDMWGEITNVGQLKGVAEEFDPLMQAKVTDVTVTMPWVRTSYGYALSVPAPEGSEGDPDKFKTVYMGVVENVLGHGEVRIKEGKSRAKFLLKKDTVQEAISASEDYVRANLSGEGTATLMDVNAKWRKDSPSEKQVALAKKLKITVSPTMSKGDLSTLISAKLGARGMGAKSGV